LGLEHLCGFRDNIAPPNIRTANRRNLTVTLNLSSRTSQTTKCVRQSHRHQIHHYLRVRRNIRPEPIFPFMRLFPQEEDCMSTNPRFSLLILGGLILSIGTGQACAQSSALDETAGPDGITQNLQLTPMQKNAIYNAVMQQHMLSSSGRIAAKIGAPVPPSTPLYDLPDQAVLGAGVGAGADSPLKYAMVGSDIVVVDPISMRVIDVIGQGAGR
jgi:hypothetical protein